MMYFFLVVCFLVTLVVHVIHKNNKKHAPKVYLGYSHVGNEGIIRTIAMREAVKKLKTLYNERL
jgi:hypothetical protein